MPMPSPFEPGEFSPVLAAVAGSVRPDPEPACATCPVAVWQRLDDDLRCFCRVLQRISWDGHARIVTACDAREAALLDEAG